MIDTADLQSFLAKIEGGAVAVDLLKIGENNHQQYADEEYDERLDELEDDLTVVFSCRYSFQSSVPKSTGFLDSVLFNLDDRRFKRYVRCSRKHFDVILDKIKDHSVFHGKNSGKQLSVFYQLAIVMYRIGSSGNGASVGKIAGLFGVGDGGTVDRITERVFEAVLSLETEYLNWPSEEERIGLVHDTMHELPYCVMYTDGMEVPLDEAPCKDKESYFSRSKKYSIKLQGSCDHTLKLRHILIGYPGSVHDARIFNSSELALTPQKFLSGEQWIAADSAYRLTQHVITPFRRNNTSAGSADRKNFNRYFSSFRVRIEHCFGILKEIFPSLKSLRVRIQDQNSHKFACTWIRVCCVLYNIILPYVEVSEYPYTPTEEDDFIASSDIDKMGEAKRLALLQILLESGPEM